MRVITTKSSVFRSLAEQVAEIAVHIHTASGNKKAASSGRLLTTREVTQLLNVGARTLQCIRSGQRIIYIVLHGKCYYRQSKTDRLLDECTVNKNTAISQGLEHNHTLRTGGTPKGRRTQLWNRSHKISSGAGRRS